MSSFANKIGSRVVPFMNPRVVCPPGVAGHHKRPNVMVATPMRSGTHIAIDLILNNIPALRTRPLYVDLDQCVLQSTDQHDLVRAVRQDAGHLIKTHMPVNVGTSILQDRRVLGLIDAATVITIRRDEAEIEQSLARWHRDAGELAKHRDDVRSFWDFWDSRPSIALNFEDLFDPTAVSALLDQVARATATMRRRRLRMPPPLRPTTIYLNKASTRLIGRHAPRIDTTIHTSK